MKTPPKAAKLFRAASDSAFRGDTPTANRLYDTGNREIKKVKTPLKSFKEHLKECGDSIRSLGGSANAQTGRWGQEPVHLGIHRLEDPRVLQSLNAHIGTVNTREYIDPLAALEHVQNALMRIGYQFQYNADQLPQQEELYRLSRFGGRQGFVDMDGLMKEDDFIAPKLGEGVVLHVEFNRDPVSSRYTVNAQILPEGLFEPEEIAMNRAGAPSTTGDKFGLNAGMSEGHEEPDGDEYGCPEDEEYEEDIEFNYDDDEDNKTGKDFEEAADRIAAEAIRKLTGEGIMPFITGGVIGGKKKRKSVREFFDAAVVVKEAAEELFTAVVLKGNKVVDQMSALEKGEVRHAVAMFKERHPGAKVSIEDESGRVVRVEEGIGWGPGRSASEMKKSKLLRKKRGEKSRAAAAAAAPKKVEAKGIKEDSDVFKKHSLRIARDTIKMNSAMAKMMGGMSGQEAIDFLLRHGSSTDKAAAKQAQKVESIAIEAMREAKTTKKGTYSYKGQIYPVRTQSPFKGGLSGSSDIYSIIKKSAKASKKSSIKEDVERTFEFSSADDRDRMAKLLGLASGGKVTANNKGGKFQVSGSFKAGQIDRLINSAKQLNGKLEEAKSNEVPMSHHLKVARDTLKMHPAMLGVMGGPSKREASNFLRKHGSAADKKAVRQARSESIAAEVMREAKKLFTKEDLEQLGSNWYRARVADYPKFKDFVKKAFPSYGKREVSLVLGTNSVELRGGYWDEGSRTEWFGLRPDGSSFPLTYPTAPAHFGGGKAPRFEVEDGKILAQGGTSMGKPSSLKFYMTRSDAIKLGLPNTNLGSPTGA